MGRGRVRGPGILVALLLLVVAVGPGRAATNDDRANAIEITTLAYSVSIDTTLYTVAPGDPDLCGNSGTGGATAWWRIRPAVNGTFAADTVGSAYDTVLAVFEAAGGGLGTRIACNDDSGDPNGASRLTAVPLLGGQAYYVEVAAHGAASEGADPAVLTTSFAPRMPVLHALQPAVVPAGSPVLLTIEGADIAPGAQVHVGSAVRAPASVAPTAVTVALAAEDVATPGSRQVALSYTGLAGGTTNALVLTVGNPLPAIAAVVPPVFDGGSGPQLFDVQGSGFVGTSSVRWGGQSLSTTYVSATLLRATVPATLLAATGFVPVTVANPAPAGGTSAAFDVLVRSPADVNCDAAVDFADAVHVLRLLEGQTAPPGCPADVDRSGTLPDGSDATLLLAVLAGLAPMP